MRHELSFITVCVVVGMIVIVLTAWRDYLAFPKTYDCGMLMSGWHPDAPVEVIEKCRKKGYPYDSSKTRN